MERIGLFHVPLLVGKCDLPHEEIAAYVRDRIYSWGKSYTSYYDNEFNENLKKNMPAKEKFETIASELATKYCKEHRSFDIGQPDVKKLGYWFSVYREGDSHCLHNHPGSRVAGTYYPYADDNSVPIRYRNPSGHLIEMSEPKGNSENWYFHYPKSGEMNFWPPWLEHQVGTQGPVDDEKTRIAISFNYGKV